jgi:hypothetical protein
MTAREVAAEYEVEPIVAAIARALARQAEGKSTARAEKLRDKAARLRAVVRLLGGGQ